MSARHRTESVRTNDRTFFDIRFLLVRESCGVVRSMRGGYSSIISAILSARLSHQLNARDFSDDRLIARGYSQTQECRMTKLRDFIGITWLVTTLLSSGDSTLAQTEHPLAVKNERGLQLLAVTEAMQPTLRVVLPGH